MADKKGRLEKLEAKMRRTDLALPKLIVVQPGETEAEAILRVCGPGGLPPVPPGGPPNIIVVPVSGKRSRNEAQ